MTEAHFIIVWVMGRRDLHATGAEFWIHKIIGNDRNRLVLQRQQTLASNQVCVPRVLGIHGHCFVTEHRLRPRGGDDDELIWFGLSFIVQQRIFDVPQLALLLDHLHFFV